MFIQNLFDKLGPVICLFATVCSAESIKKEDHILSFSVEVQELSVDMNQFFAVAMPDELLEFDVLLPPDTERSFSFETTGGQNTIEAPLALAWQAPKEPGVYDISITAEDTQETMQIRIFVMRPLSEAKNGVLNGYKIGQYPDKPLRDNPKYLAPAGLIEYTADMKDMKISPHFKLSQFLCKQASKSKNKYLLVQPTLILKLERLMTEVKAKNIPLDTFFVMSGYRTPFYNKAIGNVKYSRHVFGDAADIFIDFNPKNNYMDDINADGIVNRKDAAYLFDMAADLDKVLAAIGLAGGVGEYKANAVRGPFVHVDTRGYQARWGR